MTGQATGGQPVKIPDRSPARLVPFGMVAEVSDMLTSWGLTADWTEVAKTLAALVNATPVADGGRLRPDGTVDRSS